MGAFLLVIAISLILTMPTGLRVWAWLTLGVLCILRYAYIYSDRYIMGMDSIFTSNSHPDIFWLYKHIISGEPICPEKECLNGSTMDAYTAIHEKFRAGYVFTDSAEKIGSYNIGSNKKFTDQITSDSRFKEVYVDPEYPEIKVYEL